MTQLRSLEEELEHYAFSFPILEKLQAFLDSKGDLAGRRIGWHCHLTGLTAASAKVLIKAGAKLFLSECAASTSDWAAVNYMKQLGAQVYQGAEGPRKVLENKPEIISDTGFVLSNEYLKDLAEGKDYVFAGCEITTSGIVKLRQQPEMMFSVININDCELKTLIENYHGVGDGVMEALFRLTGRVWAGRAAAVVGYGRVGAGVAEHLRRAGATVYVVENDPIRRLVAHYDGFGLMRLSAALSSCELVVTATGSKFVIGGDELRFCRDGVILMNVGHWAEEIDMLGLRSRCVSMRTVAKHLDEFELESEDGTKKVYVVGAGGPANVVMLSGSPEPTLIHLSTEILCMRYLLNLKEQKQTLAAGENRVPQDVQRQAALLALQSLNLD